MSCVLPTKNRARFIRLALQSFFSQTYPHKELVILDNGTDDTAAYLPDHPAIRYQRIEGAYTTGEMRNLCNAAAQGTILCHFDSDDWSAPTRLTTQVALLATHVLTGYATMLFYELQTRKVYHWAMPGRKFALGTSLCYHKAVWERQPFLSRQVGEDSAFFNQILKGHPQQVSTPPVGQLMVALIHAHQTSPKHTQSARYQELPPTVLPETFLHACEHYL